jgi:REP element-mobilizing transposase RayT
MRHHRLLVHLVWTTRGREPLITLRLAEFLANFLPAVARQEGAVVLARGFVSTHIHLLIRLDPTTDIPRLVQRLKGGSAAIAEKEKHNDGRPLRWAKGYSISSVSTQAVPKVISYVKGQARRHPREAIMGWDDAEALAESDS